MFAKNDLTFSRFMLSYRKYGDDIWIKHILY